MTTADVGIIGGGVIGCSIAYHLSRAGVENVVIFECGHLGGGATGLCPGGIRQQFDGEAECRFAQRSVRFFDRINEILEPDMPFRFERDGYLFIADTPAFLDELRQRVIRQNALGIPSRVLEPDALASLFPDIDLAGVLGASFCAEDGFLEDCQGVAAWLARRARDRGARVVYDEIVRIALGPGPLTVVGRRQSMEVEQLVVAAGVRSAELMPAGIEPPLRAERRRLAYTEPFHSMIARPLIVAPEREFAGKQLTTRGFYLGWLRETASDDDVRFVEQSLSRGASLIPVLARIGVRRTVTGWYDVTPDRRPILGPLPGLRRLHLAAGFSGHGFMLAPAVGEAIAAGILGQQIDLPVEAFSMARFSEPTIVEAMMI